LKVEEGLRTDPKVPAGQILAQDPAPGAVPVERSVKVWSRRAATVVLACSATPIDRLSPDFSRTA
jgi:hypothetical protein